MDHTKKKLSPLMICHLVLMVVLAVASLVIVVILFAGAVTGSTAGYVTWKTSVVLAAFLHIARALALCSGILYLFKGYSKNASGFYKAFMLLLAFSSLISAITLITVSVNSTADVRLGSNMQYTIGIILRIAKVVLILCLAFAKDLGKRNTWILFCVLLVSDLIANALTINTDDILMITLTSSLAKLFMDGTIGLAIKGKYDDKDRRGTT